MDQVEAGWQTKLIWSASKGWRRPVVCAVQVVVCAVQVVLGCLAAWLQVPCLQQAGVAGQAADAVRDGGNHLLLQPPAVRPHAAHRAAHLRSHRQAGRPCTHGSIHVRVQPAL